MSRCWAHLGWMGERCGGGLGVGEKYAQASDLYCVLGETL